MYIAQSDLEAYMGDSLTANGIAFFNLIGPMLQDTIDQYCNRSWNITNPITEYFDALQKVTSPYATDAFFPLHPVSKNIYDATHPLAQGVHSVTIAGIAWDMNFVYSYGQYVSLWVRPMTITLPNPLGFRSVVVVYDTDDAGACPNPVKLAFLMWMSRMLQESTDAGKTAVQVQAGTVLTRFAQDKDGAIPDFVKAVLNNYRIIPMDHF